MSTKTTFKRVALVAVVALGLGGFSAVSSQAATANSYIQCEVADGLTAGTNTLASTTTNGSCSGVAGAYNYVTLKISNDADNVITSTTAIDAASGVATVSADKLSAVTVATGNIKIATPAVGTITVSYWKRTAGVLASTAAETVTITVGAASLSGKYSATNSTVYMTGTDTSTALTADATVTVAAGAGAAAGDLASTAAAYIKVTLLDGTGSAGAAYNDTVTATITSGPGVVSAGAGASVGAGGVAVANQYSKSVYTSSGKATFNVFSNGLAGTTVVSIKDSAGTVLATKSLTFSGKTAKLVATTAINYISTTAANAFKVVATDAAGNPVASAGVDISLATADALNATVTTACAEQTTKGTYLCSIAGKSDGTEGVVTATFTAHDVSTVTTTAKTTLSSKVATTLTITPSADTVAAGDKVTYTLTATDAKGFPVADAADYVFFTTVDTNASFPSGALWTSAAITTVDGKATVSVYAPQSSYKTTFTLTGTAGTASTNLVAALTGTDVVVPVAVTNAAADAAAAAIDAAQEATDAANAAYDAANNAMDSADAATAAAQDAADNAAQALTAVTALSATVAKLVKQISAIAATLAKIQKKIGA